MNLVRGNSTVSCLDSIRKMRAVTNNSILDIDNVIYSWWNGFTKNGLWKTGGNWSKTKFGGFDHLSLNSIIFRTEMFGKDGKN